MIDDLDLLLGEARESIAASIDDELAAIAPDFAAVVDEARARGIADASAPELAAPTSATEDDDEDELASLIAEARHEVDADVAARRLLPLPAAPLAPVAEPRGSRVRWLGALVAVAAALALVWGLQPFLARQLAGGERTGSQAQWSEPAPGSASQASARDDEPAAAPRRRPARASGVREDMPEETMPEEQVDLDAQDEPAAPAEADIEAEAEVAADDDEASTGGATASRRASDPAAALRRLEAEAEARWRAGDLAGAESRLRRIIRSADDPQRADLAYGDLFTVTRQLHGRAREAAVWEEYLRRFPRGRYADDARAGLCRRADDADASECWRRYLEAFPRGTHRAEAERSSERE
ncbi:MAG: hypothetical protein H6710_01300 [Myxococcales bacterium]|nr:hypothetical protein [Myxococcales bacterium]MCB9702956.1 hypothetical protein [Myxococcales bacterium]